MSGPASGFADQWELRYLRLTLMERLTGRAYGWVRPTIMCNERGCWNGADGGGKCALCNDRISPAGTGGAR